MWGISWGGFNSLQIAARRPPALQAIITPREALVEERRAPHRPILPGGACAGRLNPRLTLHNRTFTAAGL
jgi:predicted acyl esterase